ncbi:hypothetical protein [Nonomuraea sp. CA-141351]|uniref:hypothetical protein n=1 Tax=Nonomuraea sp. CA-141351 TaxID=3239996 RepID=UPI003D8B9652
MRLHCLAALPVAGLLSAVTVTAVQAPANAASAAATMAAPKLLRFGQSARVSGEWGRPLRVAPLGVYYYRPSADASIKPKQKWFVAVAIRVTALFKADRMPDPISGNMWRVKSGARTFDTNSGNVMSAPWAGRVNEGVMNVKPGHPDVVIKTFDLPRAGGTLEWATRNGTPIRWQIPAKNTGKTSYQQVLDALED